MSTVQLVSIISVVIFLVALCSYLAYKLDGRGDDLWEANNRSSIAEREIMTGNIAYAARIGELNSARDKDKLKIAELMTDVLKAKDEITVLRVHLLEAEDLIKATQRHLKDLEDNSAGGWPLHEYIFSPGTYKIETVIHFT